MGAPASAVWPSTNLAIFVPFRISQPISANLLWVANGAAVSGNVDVGIYDVAGTRLVSSGSTAQAGVSVIQTFNIADTWLGAGLFYLAMAMNNTTGTTLRTALSATFALKIYGCAEQASAFALPATATFATSTQNYVPYFGLTGRTVI
jgi:hypothetical protein